jgi:uncharacterized protein (DUF1697 family)
MIYVALLRGINVGGKNKIDMKKLKKCFEDIGMRKVTTYINSGNVIFEDTDHTKGEIAVLLEEAIYKDFSLDIKVLIRSIDDFDLIMKVLPDQWKNDDDMKCDVMFLWEEIDKEILINELNIKHGIDTLMYVPGALLWSVDRKNLTKSGLMKLAASTIYKKMTIRNVNTTRKIYEIMKEVQRH